MRIAQLVVIGLLCLLVTSEAWSQQLKLGGQSASMIKSALLELNADNQGLLMPRVSDTASINALSPPDGMVIYFTSTKSLLLRSNGYWQQMSSGKFVPVNWQLAGNSGTNSATDFLGTIDNKPIIFKSFNTERLRIDGGGGIGIGTSSPSTTLHIKSGIANDAGLRLENLTSSSPATSGAVNIGVDATGKVVRTKSPVYYSGTGTTASTETVTKVWVAEIPNISGGVQTVTIPSNVGFVKILDIQLTARGGSSVTTSPIAMVSSYTTSTVTMRVLESKTSAIFLGGNAEGLDVHNDTATTIFVRVEGN